MDDATSFGRSAERALARSDAGETDRAIGEALSIGRSRRRLPAAAAIAFATAAIGGTTGTSPTPRMPNGWRGLHLDDDRVDHRHVGCDRAASGRDRGRRETGRDRATTLISASTMIGTLKPKASI